MKKLITLILLFAFVSAYAQVIVNDTIQEKKIVKKYKTKKFFKNI